MRTLTDGDRFKRVLTVAIGLTLGCTLGTEFVHGWWQLPFWIVGIPAAIVTGLLVAISVLLMAVELDGHSPSNLPRRIEGGDEHA